MTEAEQEIIRLLTEMRDAQREELVYRRRVLEESLALQKRALRAQRAGLGVVLGVFALVFVLFAVTKFLTDR